MDWNSDGHLDLLMAQTTSSDDSRMEQLERLPARFDQVARCETLTLPQRGYTALPESFGELVHIHSDGRVNT